jgi:hypothetical protein
MGMGMRRQEGDSNQDWSCKRRELPSSVEMGLQIQNMVQKEFLHYDCFLFE